MNPELSRVGERWYYNEIKQLIQEYTIDKLNVDDISIIHKRNVGGICSRLVKLDIIKERKDVRRKEDYKEKSFTLSSRVLFLENKIKELEDKIDTIQLTSLD